MIVAFTDPEIIAAVLKIKFVGEMAVDDHGVSRDAYTAFWQSFCSVHTNGEGERIPVLCPDLGREEWYAIGRILVKGYIDHQLFPIQFSLAFILALIHGESAVMPDTLLDSFMNYLSPLDKDVLIKALAGNMEQFERDDFIDMLSRFGHHTVPSTEDMKAVILQLAHKQLIQEAKYALERMADVAREKLMLYFPNPACLTEMYAAKTPTPRKVATLLHANPTTKEEDRSYTFLKLFIRGSDSPMLQKFLRFVTGSDTMSVDKITVEFSKLKGAGRRPIAHTCGAVLELPCTYGSYGEFRGEFQLILAGDFHNMDIA
jgi:hypothetical protein